MKETNQSTGAAVEKGLGVGAGEGTLFFWDRAEGTTFFLRFYLSIPERHRERQRHKQRENQGSLWGA